MSFFFSRSDAESVGGGAAPSGSAPSVPVVPVSTTPPTRMASGGIGGAATPPGAGGGGGAARGGGGSGNSLGAGAGPVSSAAGPGPWLEVTRPLLNATKEAGGSVRLRCEVAGDPPPRKIRWYKNEAPVQEERNRLVTRGYRVEVRNIKLHFLKKEVF